MTEAATDERLILAIGRIEHALSRIERRDEGHSAAAPRPDDRGAAREAVLRETMTGAIARIDALLERQEG